MTGILKVDNIQNSSGTSAMSINSSGVITTPAIPAFLATSSSGVHTTNSSSVLDFNTIRINQGGHYNTSTYTFTAPVAGLYNFYWQVYQQNGTNGKSIALQKNGSDYLIYDTAIAYFGTVNIQDHTMNSSLMMDLAVNDTIRIAVRNGSPNLQWYGGHSWFQGYLIG